MFGILVFCFGGFDGLGFHCCLVFMVLCSVCFGFVYLVVVQLVVVLGFNLYGLWYY